MVTLSNLTLVNLKFMFNHAHSAFIIGLHTVTNKKW